MAQPPKTAVGKYAANLKKGYLNYKLPIKNKWPHSAPCKKIIKLAAIEKKADNFNPTQLVRANSIDEYMHTNSVSLISLDNLFVATDGCSPKSVIVQGAPGIGKSTFAWKFCRKWAKGKLYNEFDLVVLLRMREKKVREATTLVDLFYSLDQKLSMSVAEEVISRSGKGVLLLFEGLDELPSSLLSEDSFLLEILQGISLPELTTLVTSRPWAVQGLLDKFDDQISRQVEILGFTKDDISRYVSNAFGTEEREDFMQYLYTHPQLETIMYIPLNAAFVVNIYKEFKRSNQAIPHTLTQLYTSLIKGLVYRYMKTNPDFSNVSLPDLKSLPEPYSIIFQQVCQLAFMSFTKHTIQVSFTDAEAAVSGCLDSLGLMQSSTDQSVHSGTYNIHSFRHFTIQEYLAAYYLSLQPQGNQKLFFETHASDPKFSVLLGFLIGLTSSVIQNIQRSVDMKIEPHYLHWLYESQSPQDIARCLGEGVVYFQSYFKLKPFDIYALTYCMSYSNCTWNLIIDLEDLTTVFVPTESSDVAYNGYVEELSVFNATDIGIQKLFSLPQRLFTKLHFLYFYNRDNAMQEGVRYTILASLFRATLFPNLVEFQTVANNKFGGIGIVIDALQSSCSRLNTIKIEGSVFSSSDILPLCKYLSSSKALSRVGLPRNSFLDTSVGYLLSAIPCAKSLTRLDLSHNPLTLDNLEMLSVALTTKNSTLRALRLKSCSIDAEGAEHIAAGLEDNSSVWYLFLNRNKINVAGAAALASMLTVNKTLKELHLLEDESVGIDGAIKLINALEHNKSLEALSLSPACEPVEYKSVLMKTIRNEGRVLFACVS